MSPKKNKTKQFKKAVSGDQVNLKSGTSDQAIAEAFHIIVNLRISTARSYNADFIVTDDQVKNALIKVFRNDKEQKNCSVTYGNILVRQTRSFIFLVKGIEVINKFLLTELYQYEINFD